MVTNFPLGLAAARPKSTDVSAEGSNSWLARLLLAIKQLICGLAGHDALMHFENRRVALVCSSCGHESPGWDLDARRPRIRFQGDARHHALLRARSVFIGRKTA